MRCRRNLLLTILGLVVAASALLSTAETITRCGQGWLERIDGYPVLHLKGTPYEIGFQHGALLKESIRQNFRTLLADKGAESLFGFGPVKLGPRDAVKAIVRLQEPFVPKRYLEELEGLAAGAEIPVGDAREVNFIPELFHCSGFALMNSATRGGVLYHGRLLDYAVDWGLQEHAVLIVAEPDGRLPFVNVGYSGFVGCVTGMNVAHVSIGEMGGGGLGHWQGVPMAFLMREALETGTDIDRAIAVFRDNPRTCQYYYVIADGTTNRAVGMEASWDGFTLVYPGDTHPLLPRGIRDCVILSAGSRYDELAGRIAAGLGGFTAETALGLMDRPVAMKSNLHNVLFEPRTTRFWVANASSDGQPAAEQPYRRFSLDALLARRPDADTVDLGTPAPVASSP